MIRRQPISTRPYPLVPYTTLFRSSSTPTSNAASSAPRPSPMPTSSPAAARAAPATRANSGPRARITSRATATLCSSGSMFSAVPARQMKQPRLDDEEEGNGSEAADQARPIIAEAEDDVEQDQHAQEHSRSAEAAPIG